MTRSTMVARSNSANTPSICTKRPALASATMRWRPGRSVVAPVMESVNWRVSSHPSWLAM